jgi:hypothetical protein
MITKNIISFERKPTPPFQLKESDNEKTDFSSELGEKKEDNTFYKNKDTDTVEIQQRMSENFQLNDVVVSQKSKKRKKTMQEKAIEEILAKTLGDKEEVMINQQALMKEIGVTSVTWQKYVRVLRNEIYEMVPVRYGTILRHKK